MRRLRVAVVGAGWAGLSAAVHLARCGHRPVVFEMASACGGRARSHAADRLDNGQHILIGAYSASLDLMRIVGVDPRQALLRLPLRLEFADGRGLRVGSGPPVPAFAAAVLRNKAWTLPEKIALLGQGRRWLSAGFQVATDGTVDELCQHLPIAVRQRLIEPLCVSALNTPARSASAQVFLRVLQDGLFGAPGCSDLLLPRVPLQQLLPDAAQRWLLGHGAELHLGQRVRRLERTGAQWQVGGEKVDRVVLACSATEAARLSRPWHADWSNCALALRFEPIVTVYLQHHGLGLTQPMLGLVEGTDAPAQFVFDRGQLDGRRGLFAFVVSGAARWLERGRDACAYAVEAQAAEQLRRFGWRAGLAHRVEVIAERRATFLCGPGLQRPGRRIAPGLLAAGDYVCGPYPATLEAAVRSGREAALAAADGET